jgi:hypothetical protein
VADFNNAQFATSLAGIEAMNDDISTDVIQDPDFKRAAKAWSPAPVTPDGTGSGLSRRLWRHRQQVLASTGGRRVSCT